MTGGTTTYRAGRGIDAAALLATLRREGYAVGEPESVTRTVLDTFDGRLAAAGLRLELTTPSAAGRRPAAGELVLRGADGAPARVVVSGVPSIANDVPPGPLRFRLAKLLDVRVLIPLVALSAQRTLVTKLNGAQKTTTAAVVYDAPHVGELRLAEQLVDVVELAGYSKPAAALRGVIEGVGLRESADGLAEIAAGAAGVDLAGCSVTPGVKLDADLAAIDGFRRVLANLRDAIVVNWDGTVAATDPEFLHDLRVAVRRTRAVLSNAKRVLPNDVRDRARDEFGWFGQLTGPARDLDVYQIEWPDYTGALGADTADSARTGARPSGGATRLPSMQSSPAELRGERAKQTPRLLVGLAGRGAHRGAPRQGGAADRSGGREADPAGAPHDDPARPHDRPRHPRRGAPRAAQGRQEAALPDRVLRRTVRVRAAQGVRKAAQGAPGQPRRAPGRRGARPSAAGRVGDARPRRRAPTRCWRPAS